MTSKSLRRKRRAARGEVMVAVASMSEDELREMQAELGRELHSKVQIANEVRARLEAVRDAAEKRRSVNSAGFYVSDHAVVRYLERYKGLDVKAIREEIGVLAGKTGTLSSGETYVRRDDAGTGLTLGLNETSNVVTTVFVDAQRRVMDIPE